MNLKELREHKQGLASKLNEFSLRWAEEKRAASQDERDDFDKLSDEHRSVSDEIETQERIEKAKALQAHKSDAPEVRSHKTYSPTAKDEYNCFRYWALKQAGAKIPYSLESELRSSADRCEYKDQDCKEFEIRQQSLSYTEGGYTTNSIFAHLIEAQKAYGGMYGVATILNTETGETLNFPTVDETSNTGAWLSELDGTGVTNTSVVIGQAQLSAYTCVSGVYPVSLQLLQDSRLDLSQFIGRALGTRVGRQLNNAFSIGNGSGKPTGLMQGITTGATFASQTDADVDSLTDLFFSIDPAYQPGASWMMTASMFAKIVKLKDLNDRPLYVADYVNGTPGSIYGKRVVINNDFATPATSAKVMTFGDHSLYHIRQTSATQIAVDRSLYFKSLGVAFIAYWRGDGKLLDSKAVKAGVMHA